MTLVSTRDSRKKCLSHGHSELKETQNLTLEKVIFSVVTQTTLYGFLFLDGIAPYL